MIFILLPAMLSKILLNASPGERGMGAADDITFSTISSNENGSMNIQGLLEVLEWFILPALLKLNNK